jgi:hypothetical protein
VLEKILPMPAAEWRICADGYLLVVSALHGAVAATDEPLGRYRVHRKQQLEASGFPHRPACSRCSTTRRTRSRALRGAAGGLGIAVDAHWELLNPTYLDRRLFMLVHHPTGIRSRPIPSRGWRASACGPRCPRASTPGDPEGGVLRVAAAAARRARRAITEWRIAPNTRPSFLRRPA